MNKCEPPWKQFVFVHFLKGRAFHHHFTTPGFLSSLGGINIFYPKSFFIHLQSTEFLYARSPELCISNARNHGIRFTLKLAKHKFLSVFHSLEFSLKFIKKTKNAQWQDSTNIIFLRPRPKMSQHTTHKNYPKRSGTVMYSKDILRDTK